MATYKCIYERTSGWEHLRIPVTIVPDTDNFAKRNHLAASVLKYRIGLCKACISP